jgi:hypothetical protein
MRANAAAANAISIVGSTGCQPVLFGSLPKASTPTQISLSFAHGVVGKLPITAERPALSGVYLRGWGCRWLVSLLSGFGNGRNRNTVHGPFTTTCAAELLACN